MRFALVIPMLFLLQDPPEAVLNTAKRELGDQKYKTHKEKDGSYSFDTKTVSLHVAANGEMIDKDEIISMDKAPKEVQDAVKREFAGKKTETTKVTKVSYEVKSGGVKLKIGYDGSIDRRDETIKAGDAPEAVLKAAKAKLEGSSVVKVKKVMEDGKVRYKVTVETADKKKVEATFDEDGKEIG